MHVRDTRRWSSCSKWIVSASIVFLLVGPAWASAARYLSAEAMGERLAQLAQREPKLVRVHELAQSRAGREVWIVEIGTGSAQKRSTRPAMLVVAGIEGNDLVGPVTAVAWIERLTEQYRAGPPVAKLLRATTIYVVPCLNPDAAERFFTSPKVELTTNGTPFDDDHDGLVDEDGGEDLNDDGLITMMRVEDKKGRHILDEDDSRLLLEADPLKGESGAWRLLPEGIDNDHDERWNEDGEGGVNFNRNFPYDYGYFEPDAGLHAVSEAETRALADFIVAHPNIGLVVTYGAADSLRDTPEEAPSAGRSKPMEAVDEEDIDWYEVFGQMYRETLGLDEELECLSEPGTFSDWMYFHRGRLSVAVRPWDVTLARAIAESENEQGEAEEEGDEDEDEEAAEQRDDLRWFDEHAPDSFIAWEAIDHPDFPGQRVEVGGYRPFVRTNPPVTMLADVATTQGKFLTELAQRLPRIQVGKIECRLLADSIYEIEIDVVNAGFLPTALAHGETCRAVHPTRIVLNLPQECFLSGERTTFLPTIAGSGGVAKARYTIRAPDRQSIRFEVVSMLAGRVKGRVELLRTALLQNERSAYFEREESVSRFSPLKPYGLDTERASRFFKEIERRDFLEEYRPNVHFAEIKAGTSATDTNHSSQVQDSDHGISTAK